LSVPEAKDAILAAVSHPTYKLKWVPPDNCSEVSRAFVEAVAMKDTTVAESTSSQLIASLEGDDTLITSQSNVHRVSKNDADFRSQQLRRASTDCDNIWQRRRRMLIKYAIKR